MYKYVFSITRIRVRKTIEASSPTTALMNGQVTTESNSRIRYVKALESAVAALRSNTMTTRLRNYYYIPILFR